MLRALRVSAVNAYGRLMPDPDPADNPFYRVRVDEARWPDGRTGPYYVVEFHHPCVMVVPRGSDGRLLLVQVWRHVVGAACWEFPAGLVDPGEHSEDAARRELLEESGYEAGALLSLGRLFPLYGAVALEAAAYLAPAPVERRAQCDPREVVARRWFARAELSALIARGALIDGCTLACLALLDEYDRRSEAPGAGRAPRGYQRAVSPPEAGV